MSVLSLSMFVLIGLATLVGTLIAYNFNRDNIPPLNATIEDPTNPAPKITLLRLDHDFLDNENKIPAETVAETPFAAGKPRSIRAVKTNAEKLEKIQKRLSEIIEWLRTDGNPGHPPSAGVSWIALAVCFGLLSPILLPMIFSPLILVIGFFVFLPAIVKEVHELVGEGE